MKKILIIVLVLQATAVNAVTNYMSGNKFYDMLKEARNSNSTNYIHSGMAMGYLEGVVDSTNGIRNPSSGTLFCVPNGVSLNQLMDITYIYFEQNPQLRHYTADSLISTAIQKSFPCK